MKFVKISAKSLPRVMYAHECVISDIKCKARINNYHELTFVEEGRMRVRCDELGLDEVIGDGGFFFAPADIAYETSIEGRFHHSCMAFFDDDTFSVCNENEVVYRKSDNRVFIVLEDMYIPVVGKISGFRTKTVLTRIIECVNGGNEEYANLKCSCLALELLLSVAKKEGTETELPSDGYYADKVNKYIAQNYNDPDICMNVIAENVGLHPNYMSSLYKKVTGESVMSVVRSMRISQAKNLLRLNKYLVKDVARMVGFSDCNYFSVLFHKVVGVRAEEYYKT